MTNNNINIIFNNANNETILRAILEQMQPHQVDRIRHSIKPHWADGMYGDWKHSDPLMEFCFSKAFTKVIEITDCCGDDEYSPVTHKTCLLCGETLIVDKDIHDYRYSHLFSNCMKSTQLMDKANTESDYRDLVNRYLKTL